MLEKSINNGKSWEPLEYYSNDCEKDFHLVTKRTQGFGSVTEVLCSNPNKDSQVITDSLKRVTWPLASRLNSLIANGANWENLYTEIERNAVLKNFLKMTDLRLRLMRPATIEGTPQPADLNRYHYAIYDINTQLR